MISEPFDFMIFPNWVIAERSSMKSLQIVHKDFLYKLTTMADSLPTRVDKLVLLALLNQFESGVFAVATTIYSLAKAISPKGCINDLQYRRVIKALNRWLNIRIKLSAWSSEETVYQIIDSVSRDKEKLTIGFNPVFVKDYIESGCSDTQSLSVLYELKSPASARLYEILSRQFLDKMIWRISLEELKTLMTINAVYPSQILRVITKAVEELNKKSDAMITLSTATSRYNSTILTFESSRQSSKIPLEFQPLRRQTSASTPFNP